MNYLLKRGYYLATPIFLAFSVGSASSDEDSKKEIFIPPTAAREVMTAIADENFVGILNKEQAEHLTNTLQKRNPLPNEALEHADGLYGMENAQLYVDGFNPIDFSFRAEHRLRLVNPETQFLSQKQSQEVALRFLRRTFPWFFESGDLPEVVVKTDQHNAIFDFAWRRYDDQGVPSGSVNAQIRAIDGKVVTFWGSRMPVASKRIAVRVHKISWLQARERALRFIQNSKRWDKVRITRVGIYSVNGELFSDKGEFYYAVQAEAHEKVTGLVYNAQVQIDATSGEVDPFGFTMEVVNPETQGVDDRQPIWTKQGLLFISRRSLVGYPAWFDTKLQIFLRTKEKLTYLTCDLSQAGGGISLAQLPPTSSWSAFGRFAWTYALDPTTGSYRVLGTPERFGATPTLSPDGKWAIVSAEAPTGSTDGDLFADNLQRASQLALRGRLVLPNGDDYLPLYSPDGKWLYFITSKRSNGTEVSSLRRIPASLAHTKQLLRLKPEQVETLVAAMPGGVGSPSIFPNGQKLLLTTRDGLTVVDIATRKATLLKLPILKDIEVGGATISNLQDGWAGPGNDEVTFSGQTTDATKKVRRRIYSCRFNGTNLRAWTPKENTPVPGYVFPQTKKTAYDLAKEMALAEIKWEDAHRER